MTIWLNLGCSDNILEGFENVDYYCASDPKVTKCDLNLKWHKWQDGSVDFILAHDIIEHLRDKIHTMNEAYRVLKPGGVIDIIVPTTDGPGAFQDPTHITYWNRNSFKYFESGNPYRERFCEAYGIKAKFEIMGSQIDDTQDGPKLHIQLKAVKDEQHTA